MFVLSRSKSCPDKNVMVFATRISRNIKHLNMYVYVCFIHKNTQIQCRGFFFCCVPRARHFTPQRTRTCVIFSYYSTAVRAIRSVITASGGHKNRTPHHKTHHTSRPQATRSTARICEQRFIDQGRASRGRSSFVADIIHVFGVAVKSPIEWREVCLCC